MGPAVEPQLWEAPVMSEGSCVGLDVHARSVVAGVIDVGSGEVRSLRVPPGAEATVAWLKTLPAPVRVVYEAGPTGYRLARSCAEAGISCVVAAPSKIRPAADRVKTDRRDAERLARLLRLGEITPECSGMTPDGVSLVGRSSDEFSVVRQSLPRTACRIRRGRSSRGERSHEMTRYLTSFPSGAMEQIPAEEMPAVGEAAHAVVQE